MLTRRFIAGAAATGLAAPAILRSQTQWRNYPFSLGIASGDPAPDGFVIWTRLAPDPLEPHGGMGMGAMPVKWEVASDERFQTIVAQGEAQARPELAHSVHVEVTGLQPDRPYWYRFEAGGERTIRGRARTLPDPASAPQALRFGVAGCQNFEDGLYTAYRHLAREDLAFVFHYGDYIYEYRGDPLRPQHWTGDVFVPVRQHAGQLLFSIDDYRRRYAQYKTDADLQRAHAAHAFFTTFDDHEIDNNWVADIDQRDTPPEVFRLRRAAAFQAWYEHMPVRRTSFPDAAAIQAYRSARFGNLAELNFLDTRQYRSDQPCDDGFKPVCADVRSAETTMLGAEQEAWLARNLQRRDVRWNCLAQQVMMMSVDRRRSPDEAPAKIMNMDTWAAYEGPRQRLFARLRGLDNVVVLTGRIAPRRPRPPDRSRVRFHLHFQRRRRPGPSPGKRHDPRQQSPAQVRQRPARLPDLRRDAGRMADQLHGRRPRVHAGRNAEQARHPRRAARAGGSAEQLMRGDFDRAARARLGLPAADGAGRFG
jgi:alkaline phosphatase D